MKANTFKAPPRRREKTFWKMSPGARVEMALELSSLASGITLESVLNRNPKLSPGRILEKARKRFQSGRRSR